jgi:NADP-dependent 3-hydroxy acid dehydrogenase YdfG
MNKIALITGATSGIGKATAIQFAQNNYQLILTGRRNDRLVALKNELSASYQTEILTLNFDVQDNEAVQNALASLPAAWKKIDVLVNNAGLSLGLDPIQSANLADWEQMIDTNVKGLLYVSKIVSNWMIENKSGHIINIGSIAGKETYANGNVYCATKHAVDSLNKAMRLDLLTSGIRVTAIHPGAVETEFSVVRFKGDQARADKVYEGFEPLRPSDIADAIYYASQTPPHVNINEIIIMPTAQANAGTIFRQS